MLRFCLFIFLTSQEEIKAEEIALITYVIFFTLVLLGAFVVFFTTFQKRKNLLLIQNLEQQKRFDETLVKSQQEIQEETLKHIGRELHDNVGQLLSVATMQMNAVKKVVEDNVKSKVDNASEALKESLSEVRALSKSLNSDVIFNLGFNTTLENEINRLNKTGLLDVSLNVEGEASYFQNQKDAIILFRILQEFFSNTLKYAEAENVFVHINYQPEALHIKLEDNGIGFDINEIKEGSGMTNMKKRAEIIEAQFQLDSVLEKGTSLSIIYPYRAQQD